MTNQPTDPTPRIYNARSRGFDSIYLQTPQLPPADHDDFPNYTLVWSQIVRAHIEGAEEFAGPRIAEVTGEEDILTVSGDLKDALQRLQEHLRTSLITSHNNPREDSSDNNQSSPSDLITLLDALRGPLSSFLLHELDTRRSLSKHGQTIDVDKLVSEDRDKTWESSPSSGKCLSFL